MTRAKTRRPGTKSGKRADSIVGNARPRRPPPPPSSRELPEDLPDAAEAALDDLIMASGEFPVVEESTQNIDDEVPQKPPPPPRPKTNPPKRARTDPARKRAASPVSDEQLVEATLLPEIEPLRFAVFEQADQLGSARSAIAAAGHVVAVGGSGTAGLRELAEAIIDGNVDALLVTIPGGEVLIDAALALEPRRPVVIAALGGSGVDAVARATAAGADLVAVRPHDVDRIAPVLLAAARVQLERRLTQTARGAELVLRAKLEEIADPDPRGLQPMEVFQRQLELEFKRAKRFEYPLSVALFAVDVPPPPPPAGIRGILRARAGNALIHTIRDIDLATQLDHERFLVLLPYTDLAGAAKLGRRVIAAVADNEPVVSGGRTFPSRIVGAVTSAPPGQPLSFAKLMKEATRALEQARKDGAELAVQP